MLHMSKRLQHWREPDRLSPSSLSIGLKVRPLYLICNMNTSWHCAKICLGVTGFRGYIGMSHHQTLIFRSIPQPLKAFMSVWYLLPYYPHSKPSVHYCLQVLLLSCATCACMLEQVILVCGHFIWNFNSKAELYTSSRHGNSIMLLSRADPSWHTLMSH